ncbi:MAG: carbon storage regulator CsrA [Clostridiales bacterium]|nr:carbon storage regulator CsrA [Eubacterium sp.]MDD5995129.1 carbon storage regulator CsrA [Clostridiales bacterium]MDD7348588.1 carbon storage regulator CsrA [Clostridiales bacterium]MDY3773965.1 carbon storage regulator CsrA [Eubacterium sp.]
MLALARKVNESIVINDDVEVTILEIKGDQVKIGINAPKSVPIYRKELYVQIQKANEEAVNSADPNTLKDLFK